MAVNILVVDLYFLQKVENWQPVVERKCTIIDLLCTCCTKMKMNIFLTEVCEKPPVYIYIYALM